MTFSRGQRTNKMLQAKMTGCHYQHARKRQDLYRGWAYYFAASQWLVQRATRLTVVGDLRHH